MEAAINKPDNQFKDLLNDITDFTNLDTCNARIKELSGPSNLTSASKPANSLNSSTYSSAASSSSSSASSTSSSISSSSSSTSSDSNANPASSTSSTLSSPSQSSETITNNNNNNRKQPENNENIENASSKVEIARIEDLGKKATILGHKVTAQHYKYSRDNTSSFSASLHSDKFNTNSLTAKNSVYKFAPRSNTINTTNTTAINHNTSTNLTSEGVVSGDIWKTINGKRDKKRRKPTEQPVLSEDIPGHKGTQELDWLVNFINESGTNGSNSTSSSNKNNTKNKVQSKIENTNHHSTTRIRNTKNSNSSSAAPTINSTKRQENFSISNQKSQQAPTKMSSHTIQNKAPNQSNTNQIQPTSTKSDQGLNLTSQTQHRKQTQANQNNAAQLQDSNVTNNITDQPSRNQYKPANVSQNRNLNNRHKGLQTSLIEQSQQPEAHSKSPSENTKSEPVLSSKITTERHQGKKETTTPKEDIVTFAEHIRVDDQELGLYTFGFFDEASSNQATIIPKSNKSNHVSNETKIQKQSNQMVRETKIEHSKASPDSEKKRRKFNDNIDTNSFNYNQVLEFISNAWESKAKSRQAKPKATHSGR